MSSGEVSVSSGLNVQLEKLIKFYLKTLGKVLDMEEDEEDNCTKKLVDILITGVNIVALQLPVTESCIIKVLCVISFFLFNNKAHQQPSY